MVRKKKNKSVLCASETDAGREVCVKGRSSYADGVIVKTLEPLVTRMPPPAAATVEDEALRADAADTTAGTRPAEEVVKVPLRETDDAMLLDREVVRADAEVLLIPMMPSGDRDVVLDVILEVPFVDMDVDADDRKPLDVDEEVGAEDDVEFAVPVIDVCDVCAADDVVPTKIIAAEDDCGEDDVEDVSGPELVPDAVGVTVEDGVPDPEMLLEDERVDVKVPDPEVRVEVEVEVSNDVPSTPTDISTETAPVDSAFTEASPDAPTACLRSL